jgi:hypothetical protein
VPAQEKPAPFERRVVGPVIAGAGQSFLMSFVLPRFFYCVCMEDALVFVPRPWICGPWPTILASLATSCASWWYRLLRTSGLDYRHPWAPGLALIVVLIWAAITVALWVYHFAAAHQFCERLAGAPPWEIPANEGPSRVELSTVRSLKVHSWRLFSWRLLLVRKGEEDFAFRIAFLEEHEVEEALEKAYPGLLVSDVDAEGNRPVRLSSWVRLVNVGGASIGLGAVLVAACHPDPHRYIRHRGDSDFWAPGSVLGIVLVAVGIAFVAASRIWGPRGDRK